MSNAKGNPTGLISGRSKTNLKTKSKVGFLDASERGDGASSTSLRLRINEYSGQLSPNKKPKIEVETHAIAAEDVRNPMTFKSQVDVKKIDFDLYDTTQLVLGPTSGAPNYSYFTKRIERVYIFMLVLATSTASLVAILLYTHFILPPFLYAKDEMVEFFSSAKSKWIFHCSIPPITLLITIIYNVAVLQFHKAVSWKKFAPIRWAVFLIVEIYLVMSTCYYLSQINGIGEKIEIAMAKDFDRKYYMNHRNDPSISSVYRWVRGSRIEHVQVYYHCCGMNSWRDWDPVLKYWEKAKNKHFLHGDLCNPESDLYNEDTWKFSEFRRDNKICKTPHTCWKKGQINITGMNKYKNRVTPVDFETRKSIPPSLTYSGILGIHDDLSCLYAETVMAYTVIALYIFILSCLIAFSSFVFWRTRGLIDVANKMKIDLYTRPKFEECL